MFSSWKLTFTWTDNYCIWDKKCPQHWSVIIWRVSANLWHSSHKMYPSRWWIIQQPYPDNTCPPSIWIVTNIGLGHNLGLSVMVITWLMAHSLHTPHGITMALDQKLDSKLTRVPPFALIFDRVWVTDLHCHSRFKNGEKSFWKIAEIQLWILFNIWGLLWVLKQLNTHNGYPVLVQCSWSRCIRGWQENIEQMGGQYYSVMEWGLSFKLAQNCNICNNAVLW